MAGLDKCLKSRVPIDSSTNNMANVPKRCCNLNKTTFAIFINHCEQNCIGKSLRLFDNTLPADDKHYLLNRDNLTQTIQMQLFQKQK